MGSKAFLSMGVLIFTALLFASDQVIARDLAETPTYHKNEDGTIKPNGVGKAKNVYERSFDGGNDGGHRGVGNPIYNRNGPDFLTPHSKDPNHPVPYPYRKQPYGKPTPYGPDHPTPYGKPSPYRRHYPPAYNRGGYP